DVWSLFMIIDADRSGLIDLEEFVAGCMQLHGPAKSLHVAKMSHDNKVTRQMLQEVEARSEDPKKHGQPLLHCNICSTEVNAKRESTIHFMRQHA
ncbi:hypothetical protein AK812_SmicGene45627, partial [Symbiodinium microadriaticum]